MSRPQTIEYSTVGNICFFDSNRYFSENNRWVPLWFSSRSFFEIIKFQEANKLLPFFSLKKKSKWIITTKLTAKTIFSQFPRSISFRPLRCISSSRSLFSLLFWYYSKSGAHMGLPEKHLAVVIMKSFRALIYSQFIPK